MTKETSLGWMNIGVAVFLIVSAIIAFVGKAASTQQLLLEGLLVACSVGLLARGVSRVVAARRR